MAEPIIPVTQLEVKLEFGPPSTSTITDVASNTNEVIADIEELIEEIVDVSNVTVKFRISDAQMFAQIYPNRTSVYDIKTDIGQKFEVDPELLILKQLDDELCDDCILINTCHNEFGIHEFDLSLKKIEKPKAQVVEKFKILNKEKLKEQEKEPILDMNVYYKKQQLPDFITVYIPADEELGIEPKTVVVEIQNKAIEKPFLCGYKDKRTGIEYLDGFTQTGPYFDKWLYRRYRSRDTQTHEHKDKTIDTPHDQTTQCWLDGNNVRYVSAATDFIIIPKKYKTAAQIEREQNKLAKIILIQRNWRRYLWMNKYIKVCAAEYRRLVRNRKEYEKKLKINHVLRLKREDRAKKFPCSKDDFNLLYSEIAKWKESEMKRACSMYEGPARVAEICVIMDQEVQMLNDLERQKRVVYKSMEEFRENQLLTKLGTPIKWVGYKDTIIHLDLLRTQRARYFTEIYKDMKRPLPKEKRIELLEQVKKVVQKENDWKDQTELIDLFNREKNLLIYAQFSDVEILHKRQLMLFLDLIKFSKDEVPKKKPHRLCAVCKKVKSYEQFEIRSRSKNVETCKHCFSLRENAQDNHAFNAILRAIQRDERKRKCSSSVAFVMQTDDVRYIIEKIWQGHSLLSKKNIISQLRLPRWIKSNEWAPWNCICLTEKEARNHLIIENLEEVYSWRFISEVENRCKMSRVTFKNLAAAATEFLETGRWWKVGLNRQRKLEPLNPMKPDEDEKRCIESDTEPDVLELQIKKKYSSK